MKLGIYTKVKTFLRWIKTNVKDGFCNSNIEKNQFRQKKRSREKKFKRKKRRKSKKKKKKRRRRRS